MQASSDPVAGRNASNTNVVAAKVRLGRKEVSFAINISYLLSKTNTRLTTMKIIAAKHFIPFPSSP
jgi:hypothetical protein